MKVVESKLAEAVLKLYVPENILNLNPIIAGGFVVSLYQHIIQKSSPQFDLKLEDFLVNNSGSHLPSARPFLDRFRETLGKLKDSNKEPMTFGDIDIWFLKDNEIWNVDHPLNFIVSRLEPDEPKVKRDVFSSISNHHSSQSATPTPEYPKTYYNIAQKFSNQMKYLGLSTNHGIRSATGWANTFFILSDNLQIGCPIQMVKKPQESVANLLETFDILNCCAAYHDGKFYFYNGLEEAFALGELAKGLKFSKDSIQDRIWGANRAFKYAKRYGLEFSNEICESIVQTFIDAEDFVNKLSKGQEEDVVVKTSTIELEDAYGQVMTKISKDTILSMAKTLFSNFDSLILMKNFNKEYIFAFLNSKDPGIMFEVQRYIELEEKLLRGESEAKEVSWNERYDGFF